MDHTNRASIWNHSWLLSNTRVTYLPVESRKQILNINREMETSRPVISHIWTLCKRYLIDIIIMTALVIAGGMLDLFAPPFERKIFLDDKSISYPHGADTISNVLVLVRVSDLF